MSDFRMMELFLVQVQHELLDLNTYIDINTEIEDRYYPDNYIYTLLSYNKGIYIYNDYKQIYL